MSQLAEKHQNVPVISNAQASEYDHILLIDRSGSMGDPSKRFPGKSRWEEMQEFVTGYANFASAVDEDGITVILFNGNVLTWDGVKADKVAEIFRNNTPQGSTELAAAINEANKKIRASHKKTIVFIATDGIPNDPVAVEKALASIIRDQKNEEDLGFEFIQVGDDAVATKFLQSLDDDLQTKYNLPFDSVNTLTTKQVEDYSPGQIIYLALND